MGLECIIEHICIDEVGLWMDVDGYLYFCYHALIRISKQASLELDALLAYLML